MAEVKTLQTRVALKYDSYSAWTTAPGKDLVLLKGEIGICEIPTANADSNVAPTVLFKVGNGEKTFEQLPWASAKAADVYGWAKSETVVLDGTTIKFKTGETVNHTIDLSSFATDAEVKAITDDISAKIAEIETALGVDGSNEGSVASQLSAITGRLDVIEGEAAGSIKKAAKDVADAVDAKLGADYSAEEGGITVADAIADAKQAGVDAGNAVTTLAEGAVATNTTNIGVNAAAIAELKTDLASEKSAREGADSGLDERLTKVEAFFVGAAEDKTIDGEIQNALDTLVEIQNYITSDGTAAQEMLSAIGKNAEDIVAIQDIVKDGGTLEVRVDTLEAGLAETNSEVATLKSITNGYTGADAIKTAIEAAQAQADKGVADAKTAQDAADAAQGEVDALEEVVAGVKDTAEAANGQANTNKADIAEIKSDYLKKADVYIFDCGTATTVTHTA